MVCFVKMPIRHLKSSLAQLMKLSILMPVYNERTVVEKSLSQVLAAELLKEMQAR